MGRNTSFQLHKAIVEEEKDIDLARRKFCLVMHILFTKIGVSNFLYTGEGSNIYRLVHCSSYVSKRNKFQFLLPWFSFLLQSCLTVYVLADNVRTYNEQGGFFFNTSRDEASLSLWSNLPLAIITLVYSAVVAWPGLLEAGDAYNVYGRIGPIQMFDFIVNTILPIILLFSGFFVSCFFLTSYLEVWGYPRK